jgi:hypothetical protein
VYDENTENRESKLCSERKRNDLMHDILRGYRLCARLMPLRPTTTINTSRCTKAISKAGQRIPNLLFHHFSANGSSDGNQLAATPHNPRFPLSFLLVSHLYARSAPVAVWLHSMSKRIAA